MTTETNQTDQLLRGLGFASEHWIEAHRLVATHGRGAQQHVVDLMQAALREDDEEAAQVYDTLLKLMKLRERFVRETQTSYPGSPRLAATRSAGVAPDASEESYPG